MTAPEPYRNGTHLRVNGNVIVVQMHAPNADGWRYVGIRADLIGNAVHFSHEDAEPLTNTPRPVGELLPDVVGSILQNAGLSPERFQQEQWRAHSPLGDLVETLAEEIRRGTVPPNLREAYITYIESGALYG